jgi:hypothetical protein
MRTVAARVTTAAEGLPRHHFTVAEVETMVAAGAMRKDERVERIAGELVPMSPKYRETRDFGPSDLVAPLFAPESFLLRLDDLDLI